MRRAAIAVLVVLALAAPARAQRIPPVPSVPAPTEAPWSVGVSEARKARALSLFKAGNELYLEHQAYQEALERYREALRDWDHPAIRFNMVRALVHLGRPLEAYENLLPAMAYGAAALTKEVHAEALSYRKLLEGQIATVEVSCDERGARVTIDGQALVTCPDSASRRVLPGTHQIVVGRAGRLASTRDVLAMPGRTVRVAIAPVRVEDAEIVTRRWASWKPWAVTGAGAAVAAVGAYFLVQARADMRAFDAAIGRECHTMSCGPDNLEPVILALESQARRKQWVAFGTLGVGGAAVLTGFVGVLLNRPRRELPADFRAGAFSITPETDGASLHLSLPF